MYTTTISYQVANIWIGENIDQMHKGVYWAIIFSPQKWSSSYHSPYSETIMYTGTLVFVQLTGLILGMVYKRDRFSIEASDSTYQHSPQ